MGREPAIRKDLFLLCVEFLKSPHSGSPVNDFQAKKHLCVDETERELCLWSWGLKEETERKGNKIEDCK